MKKFLYSVFAASIAMTISAAQSAEYLYKEDFGAKIVGKTLSSKTQKGKSFTSVFKSGGGGTMQIKGIKASSISWSYSGDTLCWEAYKTKECDKVEMKGAQKANFIDATSGKLNNSYSIK